MSDLRLDVYTSARRDLDNGGQFSPTTSTLLYGPTKSVLVDTQYMADDVDEVIRRIEATGTTLTAIYVTDAHADHYFGLERLLERFPTARAVAAPVVAADIASGNDTIRADWATMFSGAALDNTAIPEPLEGDTLAIDGEVLRAIVVGQADIPNNTVVHIPSIAAVVAGDVVYNGINPFLAVSDPDGWHSWLESLAKIAELEPRIVVAGHKRPELPDDDIAVSVGQTSAYLRDFLTEVEAASGSGPRRPEVSAATPTTATPAALILSAVTALKRRAAVGADRPCPDARPPVSPLRRRRRPPPRSARSS